MILCNRLKAAALIAKVVEVRIRNAGPPAIRVDLEDGHDPVRTGVRQRAQQHAIYNTEDCRGRANGQRERKDHDCGSTRVFPELAETIAAIGDDRSEPIAYPLLTNLFFHLFDAAEFDLRGALRFVRRHAGTNVFRYQHFEVGMNFMIEVCFDTARQEKISQQASSFLSERHIETLSMMFPRLARLPKKCDPIVWFRFRVASVRLCSNDSISRGGYFRTLPQKEEIQPSSSMRCRAGKSEPGLTTKVPPVICWILREIPNPCISPATRDFKISKSRVPCMRVVGPELKRYLLSTFYRKYVDQHIECQ